MLRELAIIHCEPLGLPPEVPPSRIGPGLIVFEESPWSISREWVPSIVYLLDRSRLHCLRSYNLHLLLAVFAGDGPLVLEEFTAKLSLYPAVPLVCPGENERSLFAKWLSRCPGLIRLTLPPSLRSLPFGNSSAHIRALTCGLEAATDALLRNVYDSLDQLVIRSDSAPGPSSVDHITALISQLAPATFADIADLTLPITAVRKLSECVLSVPSVTLTFPEPLPMVSTLRAFCHSTSREVRNIRIGCKQLSLEVYGRDPWLDVMLRHPLDHPVNIPSVQELDLAEQKELLDGPVSQVFPDVESVRISGVIAWRRTCTHRGTRWTPSVIYKDRLKCALDGPDGSTAVVDIEDCVTDAFAPGEIDIDVLIRRGLV